MNQMNGVSSAESEENLTASSHGWVVQMEKNLLADSNPSTEMELWHKLSVYRVPEWMKRMTNRENYRPHMVSLGPFHHGKPDLLPMEEHKHRAVRHVVMRSGKPIGEFVAAIEEVVDELLSVYHQLDGRWQGVNRDHFVEMMVADGCFLLEVTRTTLAQMTGTTGVENDYADNDPIYSKDCFDYLWPILRTDMILVENQLPLIVLQRLEAVQRGSSPSAEEINRWMLHLLRRWPEEEDIDIDISSNLALHPLDIYHKSFCGPEQQHSGPEVKNVTMPSAVELREAGIKFKKSSSHSVCDVEFKNGVLSMPLIKVNNRMAKIFLNLIVFEWLHPKARKDVMSYVFFMDNVINSGRDVALLRHMRYGIIESFMSSDKAAAALFSNMSKITRMDRYSKLATVQKEVRAHCRKPWNKWRAAFVQNHLSNPFVFISLMVATIILMATILQTVYAILAFYNNTH